MLACIRKERGYASAHQFFKSVGGSKTLGLSFMSYWDVERGKKLPKSWRIKALLAALGIEPHSPGAKELILAYFRTLSGSDELAQMLATPDAPGAELPSRELEEAAAHQAQAKCTINLTLRQWELLAKDMVTDITNDVLVDTTGWVTVEELAEATGFKPEAVKKAYKTLASAGLADISGDKARSRLSGKVINAPPRIPETIKLKIALQEHMETWLAGAEIVDRNCMSLRMTKGAVDKYRRHLETAVNLANVYGDPEANRKESAIYAIRTRIYRVAPRNAK
ncbi:MAG: hypothetical protein PHV33_10155 [Elusimicrobiales bacterium]|nr:hypothetical protein [Elusimicrobiales bacterium]